MPFKYFINFDCRHYKGEKPCRFKRECKNCLHYESMGARILIIKLAAAGDVLRTTPLLYALKKRYKKSWIVWLTDKFSIPLLEDNQYIDRLLAFGHDATIELLGQKFDLVICLDKEPRAVALANLIKADRKLGFSMMQFGTLGVFNPEATYALALGVSDPLKFYENKKTYQEIIFEATGFKYRREPYVLNLLPQVVSEAKVKLKKLGVRPGEAIGVNTGAGKIFETKKWPEKYFVELIKLIWSKTGAKIILLGGPEEAELNKRIKKTFKSDAGVVDAGTDNPLNLFCAIVSLLRLVVTADTMALHLAIALKVPVVVLLGPTCSQEIDLYGRGEIIVGKALCAPCYRASCDDPVCMESIKPKEVFEVVKRWISG